MVEALRAIGLGCDLPRATFYIWASVPKGYTSVSFTERVLKETGVVITPGSGFGFGITWGHAFAISRATKLSVRLNCLRLLRQIISFPVETFKYTIFLARIFRPPPIAALRMTVSTIVSAGAISPDRSDFKDAAVMARCRSATDWPPRLPAITRSVISSMKLRRPINPRRSCSSRPCPGKMWSNSRVAIESRWSSARVVDKNR